MKDIIIAAIIALVVGAAIGYYVGYDIGYEKARGPIPQTDENDEVVGPEATEESVYEQIGPLSGYYIQEEEIAWDEATLCDNLIVTDGFEKLLGFYEYLIESGNTVDSKDSFGRLVVTLNLDNLTDTQKDLIKNSSADAPVDLTVRVKTPNGGGAPACYSFVEVLEVTAGD
ncbi:MAG: hypothetical protein UX16_C0006G0012 [Parcubacteria group bacterium GW2011_GWB1_45_7]|nr:MAG: hypothetical protein UX16_C0006G0012 [Parcubacteria group bacterium GW2011_GWB1_45_7]